MFGRLWVRTRSVWDFWQYALTQHWALVLAIVAAAFSVMTAVSAVLTLILSIVAFVIGALTLVNDVRQARARWNRYSCTEYTDLFPLTGVQVPHGYHIVGSRFLTFPGRGTLLVDAPTDEALRGQEYRFTVLPRKYRLRPDLREFAPIVLRMFRGKRVIFNGRLLGLVDDPLPPTGSGSALVRLRPTDFYQRLASNEVCQYAIEDTETHRYIDIRRDVVVDGTNHVYGLAASDLANGIGISTIAFTTDHCLVLVQQSANNVASRTLIAPSGSGSLEPRDLRGNPPTLQQLVISGMERELCEETGLRRSQIDQTVVTGFGRWLERGACPEFFGLTRLNLSSEQLRTMRLRITGGEKLFTDHSTVVPFDLEALRRELTAKTEIHAADAVGPRIRQNGSIPLLACLRAAALAGADAWNVPAPRSP